MVFFIRETLTEEDRAGWRRVSARRNRAYRSGYRILLALWLTMKLLGLFLLGCGSQILFEVGMDDPGFFAGVLCAIEAMLCLLGGGWLILVLRHPPLRPEPLPKEDFPRFGMPDVPVRALFFGDGYFVFGGVSESVRLPYSVVESVWEDQGRFYLFFADRPPLVLPKRGFVSGTPEDYRGFLEQEQVCPVWRVK